MSDQDTTARPTRRDRLTATQANAAISHVSIRQQCEQIAVADTTEIGRAELDFWERATADAWDDLG